MQGKYNSNKIPHNIFKKINRSIVSQAKLKIVIFAKFLKNYAVVKKPGRYITKPMDVGILQ